MLPLCRYVFIDDNFIINDGLVLFAEVGKVCVWSFWNAKIFYLGGAILIRWGMIGAGNVTEIKSGPALNKVRGSELVAVMRRNASKVEDYARRHNVASWYTNTEEMLGREDLNAIYIATPPASHKEYAIAALEAGKDIYLEKPMAMNASECVEIIDKARRLGKKLSIAHYRRELGAFKKIKALIDCGSIGKIKTANIEIFRPAESNMVVSSDDNWRTNPAISGGGLFHDIAPHQIDLMIHYFGIPLDFSGYSASRLFGVADVVTGQIKFGNEIHFQGTWNFIAPKPEVRDNCTIIGEKGKIVFAFNKNLVTLVVRESKELYRFPIPENIQLPFIDKVVNYFMDEGENPCTGEDGLKVAEIIDAFTGD